MVTMLLPIPLRKSLLLATGIIVAGGTAAYVRSRFSCDKHDSHGHYNGLNSNEGNAEVVKNGSNLKKTSDKKGGLKSLKVLAAILLSRMGQMGARDLLALVGIVVRLIFVSISFSFYFSSFTSDMEQGLLSSAFDYIHANFHACTLCRFFVPL